MADQAENAQVEGMIPEVKIIRTEDTEVPMPPPGYVLTQAAGLLELREESEEPNLVFGPVLGYAIELDASERGWEVHVINDEYDIINHDCDRRYTKIEAAWALIFIYAVGIDLGEPKQSTAEEVEAIH